MKRSFLFASMAGIAILISLGIWQIQRLEWKQSILRDIENRINQEPEPLPNNLDPERDRFSAIVVDGMILPEEIHVLVSKKRDGAGYRIITPMQIHDGRRILVDRGFTQADNKDLERSTGQFEIIGNVHWPDEVDRFTPSPDYQSNIWFARDVDAMAMQLKTLPILVIARTQTDPQVIPLPVDPKSIPNNHLQYAITWFAIAAIWLAMSFYFGRRQR
ncbi:MAG: SURF1 family protein [Aestuariivita sp.]|nr:SURF1 family protein [Aestuariivita sp.]MCY4204060.1 SURF1 family protein [Aestuariivita sp.]MCY4290086.1 SURF1 family protein [Aestuariivita sp.]MCY4347982.1 SURF1 family protein [Aestuariivita sp.]